MSKIKSKKKSKGSTLLITPEPGTVAVFDDSPNWLSLKVYWNKYSGSKTNGQLYGRTASGVQSQGVTDVNAARPLVIYGDELIWTFNTTKGLNAHRSDGTPVSSLSVGDRVLIRHRRHIRDGKIFLSPDEVVVI